MALSFPIDDTCEIMTGIKQGNYIFNIEFDTDLSPTTFQVFGGGVEVDWGDGIYISYEKGIVAGTPLDVTIDIRSTEEVNQIVLVTDSILHARFINVYSLTTLKSIFKYKKKLKTFTIVGKTQATDYTSMFEGCINLEQIDGLCFECSTFLTRMFYDNESLVSINDGVAIGSAVCIDFSEMFHGCRSFVYLQPIRTGSGTNFHRMLSEMVNLVCVDSLDTRNQVDTLDMFDNTPSLLRPTAGEIDLLLAGSAFNSDGECSTGLSMYIMTDGNPTSFILDADSLVDVGNGFISYPANTLITVTTDDQVDILSNSATSIVFSTDTVTDVTFLNIENLTSMESMFEDKTVIETVTFDTESFVTDYTNMFKNSSIVTFNGPDDYEHGLDFSGMFWGTDDLTWISAMNTYNGTSFENMFNGTALTCIHEINTEKAIFPSIDLVCDDEYICATDEWTCFGASSMFMGTTLTSPDSAAQDLIINRYHFIGTEPCV